jgi:hypothetical protein
VGTVDVESHKSHGPFDPDLAVANPPSSWGTPALRSMVSDAITAAASSAMQGSSTSGNPPPSLVGASGFHPRLAANQIRGHSGLLWMGATLVLLVSVLSSFWIRRRLHRLLD